MGTRVIHLSNVFLSSHTVFSVSAKAEEKKRGKVSGRRWTENQSEAEGNDREAEMLRRESSHIQA